MRREGGERERGGGVVGREDRREGEGGREGEGERERERERERESLNAPVEYIQYVVRV